MAASRPAVADDFRIPDPLWERIAPLLPKVRRSRKGGRPRLPYRRVLDGIFYLLRTGCHGKAAPPGFGSGSSRHRYFQRWQKRGVFRQLREAALHEYDDEIGIEWEWQSLDGSMTEAPLGGKKDGQEPHGSGRDRPQAVPADRRPGRAGGSGGGRGEPPGQEARRVHPGEHPGRASRADEGRPPAPVGTRDTTTRRSGSGWPGGGTRSPSRSRRPKVPSPSSGRRFRGTGRGGGWSSGRTVG